MTKLTYSTVTNTTAYVTSCRPLHLYVIPVIQGRFGVQVTGVESRVALIPPLEVVLFLIYSSRVTMGARCMLLVP